MHPLGAQLTMSHYRLLFPLTDDNEINYYIEQVTKRNLSKRQLEEIKNSSNYEIISEKILQKLILEDIESFMKELGNYKLEIIKNGVNILMNFA